MSIIKDYNDDSFDVYCDSPDCDSHENYETEDDWQLLLSEMRLDGWKIKKTKDDWEHYCHKCTQRGIA